MNVSFLKQFLIGEICSDLVLVPIRMGYFWLSNYITDIVSAFLATGILKMEGVGGRAGWRYLFLIEGLLTLVIGLASFALLPPGPTQTKTWFNRRGWFSERYGIRFFSFIFSLIFGTYCIIQGGEHPC